MGFGLLLVLRTGTRLQDQGERQGDSGSQVHGLDCWLAVGTPWESALHVVVLGGEGSGLRWCLRGCREESKDLGQLANVERRWSSPGGVGALGCRRLG